MKTSKQNIHRWACSLLGAGLFVLCSSVAWATESAEVGIRPHNNAQGDDLVAPYGHFAFSGGGAPGPWSTVFTVSNTTSTATTVNVKCYNEFTQRVGPAAGTTFTLTAFNMNFYTPEALGLTTDPLFSGFGWCYFAVTAGDSISVGVGTGIRGIAGNTTIFGSNNSRAIAMDTAQRMVTTDDGSVPFWTKQASWTSYLLSINPTTTARSLTVNIYDDNNVFQGALVTTLSPRDLDMLVISSVGAAAFGTADVKINGRGFVGWVAGFNSASLELFLYGVPLYEFETSALAAGDRP
ncbi:MAG: hypothetical protein HY942_03680 [Gammaproteobacteria bacterium]|nr:hypothetical protein [Gammaproteobacteria bacterium]